MLLFFMSENPRHWIYKHWERADLLRVTSEINIILVIQWLIELKYIERSHFNKNIYKRMETAEAPFRQWKSQINDALRSNLSLPRVITMSLFVYSSWDY